MLQGFTMSEVDEMVKEFLIESTENLEQLDRELLILESNPKDLTTVNVIFRAIHTIKGTSGFFGFGLLESVSHAGENLLDGVRAGRVPVTDELITVLLKLTDLLKRVLGSIADCGAEGNFDCSALIQEISTLHSAPTPTSHLCPEPVTTQQEPRPEHILDTDGADSDVDPLEALFLSAQQEYSLASSQESQTDASPTSNTCPTYQTMPVQSPTAPKAKDMDSDTQRTELTETTLRVGIGLLDTLMNLVGELVLTRNQILQFTKVHKEEDFIHTSQRLNLITSELQEEVMRTRMQPISTVWNKLPRIVRDVAHSCEKEVVLETFGKETELDKTIIEAIKDPLTHIIRNAIDHGIESPASRSASGKSPRGTLTMRAFHEGGQVVIQIEDDGAGLNSDRIRAKALEKALLTSEQAAGLPESEVNQLIFLPGFSTADQVTNLSGRGVGMDVVRSNIERIGGTVEVSSKYGKGTIFSIRIPLTLAIIPALMVSAGTNRYAIPQVNLIELIRVDPLSKNSGIERVCGSEFYRLRGRLLPLIYLCSELAAPTELERDSLKPPDRALNIVVVKADTQEFGIVVDEIFDSEEIVVKPLGRLLKGITSFAGATIMGDGTVALIIDVVGLGRKSGITRKSLAAEASQTSRMDSSHQLLRKYLVFGMSAKRRAAVPLDQVYRLEEFQTSNIEYASEGAVLQYRGGILPLIDMRLSDQEVASETLRAFVCHIDGRLIGFIVDYIADIVEQSEELTPARIPGAILGSTVIDNRITDVLNLGIIVTELSPRCSTTMFHSYGEAL